MKKMKLRNFFNISAVCIRAECTQDVILSGTSEMLKWSWGKC